MLRYIVSCYLCYVSRYIVLFHGMLASYIHRVIFCYNLLYYAENYTLIRTANRYCTRL